MKLRYLSDLHLEFLTKSKLEKIITHIIPGVTNEICILAGDIGNPTSENYDIFMNFIDKSFEKSFIIPGNHEYYNKTKNMDEINDYMYKYFEKFQNISFLNNEYENYKGYCFIGTTLWTKITNPMFTINDNNYIKKFDYLKCNQLNMLCVDFLEDTIENNSNNNNIIISHHVPSNDLIDVKYKNSGMIQYNQCFYADMDYFIEKNKNKIKCWIYGHTHTPSYNIINGIPFLCNPIGYPNENSKIDLQKNIGV